MPTLTTDSPARVAALRRAAAHQGFCLRCSRRSIDKGRYALSDANTNVWVAGVE